MSPEELQIEVTTVSRTGSTVGQSAAVVFVIGGDTIRRSGASHLSELFRLVPGMDVARIDANKWAISARGFNQRFGGPGRAEPPRPPAPGAASPRWPGRLGSRFPPRGAWRTPRRSRSSAAAGAPGSHISRWRRASAISRSACARLQGCSIRCPGCCNPHLFEAAGGEAIPVARLLAEVKAAGTVIEGVTLLGGEPFDQAPPLARFAEGVRARGLSAMAFSGYTIEELRARGAAGERRWAGSTNQRFHYLTGRYTSAIERPPAGEALATIEVRLTPDGRLSANGWPLEALRRLGRAR